MAAGPLLRPGQIIRARGESWVVDRHVPGPQGSLLDVHGRGPANRGARASFLLPFELIEQLPSSDAPRVVGPRTWRHRARSILAGATPSYDALRAPARATLTILPFQLEPVLAIVRGVAARVLIADEVGLGKTVQAGLIISEVLERRPDSHVLVVTPAGLRHQWQTELRERFALGVTLIDSESITRHAAQWNGNPWSIPGVVLTSLDYVKRPEVVRALEALVWDLVIFDEAHALAGRSDRATVAGMLARRARTAVLLTATPHSGDDHAFERLTSLGDFERRFPLIVFRRTRLDAGIATTRRTVSLRVRLTPRESQMHSALTEYARLVWTQSSTAGARLAMSVLTRRACSSAWSLARSVETRLGLLGADDERDLHQLALPFDSSALDDGSPSVELSSPGLPDAAEERRWLERLLQLAQQVRDDSKIGALRRLLRRAREPAIVFTEYRDTLHQLAERLRDHAPVLLHGGLTTNERDAAVHEFTSGKTRLLLATDAASEGLNLHQRCRLVINLELPWTPVRLEQRIGRVDRLGQTQRVHAVHLLAAGTCEEESVAVLLARMRRVAGVLGTLRTWTGEPIARHVIGHEPDDIQEAERALPPGVQVGNLRSAALDEATRLEQLRTLITSSAHAVADTRPCITVLRRRSRNRVNHWAFRVMVEDAALQPLWTTVVGLGEANGLVTRSHGAIRRAFDSFHTRVDPVLDALADHLLSSCLSAIQPSYHLALQRERAIAEALRLQRARLATRLLQPGLFDRRAERAAAAQNATLDEALHRCAARLDELERSCDVAIDRRLAFGVLSR
jgi:superfamily II DNA or RNA helicase